MEERKLTKADIDKVRHIEGFPIGKDEDIIALSRPPYYTACPNPFIEDFIRENGTPYDEATDDYHREPFAADVSEGKNDPMYMTHSYHTKVPHKAIMRYILHYTKPGDIVYDGFSGSGMTGVAAQMCGTADLAVKKQMEAEFGNERIQWGARRAILNDLSPIASFLSSNYTTTFDLQKFEREAKAVIADLQKECGWMYETQHSVDGTTQVCLNGKTQMGIINNVMWSDVLVCPSCAHDFVLWDVALDKEHAKVKGKFACPFCGSELRKDECERVKTSYYDDLLKKTVTVSKQVPVLITYTVGKRRYEKKPDQYDFALLEKINNTPLPSGLPIRELPDGFNTEQPKKSHGFNYVHQFYTRRNLILLGKAYSCLYQGRLSFEFTSLLARSTKQLRFLASNYFGGGGGWVGTALSGTLYIPSFSMEVNSLLTFEGKINRYVPWNYEEKGAIVSCQSTTDLQNVPTNSIDYVFTDPPFGANINYSELSILWESWLKVTTNTHCEAIINATQRKALPEYQSIMEQCFTEYNRILKPNRWITIEFHNSQNAVWNAINEALLRAGFVVADVRTLDKKQGSFKQVNSASAVKQDLVISAYKPKESFVREFQKNAGDPEMVWEFVRQHLRNVPVVADGNHDGKLDIIAERQDYLLFDRMVAWHIMNGIPVPMDAHTFYEGLRQRFLERDGMFFLPDQVNEYDDKRAHMELDTAQLSFIVTDEKNAIQWLNYILAQGPMTYQEIQPLYMQELHQSRQEKMPELLDMLKENFVQDDKGAWYVPDLTNAADLAKVRRKALLKEFWDSCATGKGKLKVFRMEAIRAGFDECWKTRDFKTIVAVGERLPEAVLQEDPALLMYYDNACSRV